MSEMVREPLTLTVFMPGEEPVVVATLNGDKFHWNENATTERLRFIFECQYQGHQRAMAQWSAEREAFMGGLANIGAILQK